MGMGRDRGDGEWLKYTWLIMSAMASQITSLTIVYSSVYSDANQSKHQSSASLLYGVGGGWGWVGGWGGGGGGGGWGGWVGGWGVGGWGDGWGGGGWVGGGGGMHRWPVNSPHKGPVTRKLYPFDDVIMLNNHRKPCVYYIGHSIYTEHISFVNTLPRNV